MACSSLPWHSLPTEMKFSILDHLDISEVRAFATLSKESYTLSIPSIWRNVEIKSYEALQAYLGSVPAQYGRYTRQLTLCTKSVDDGPYSRAIDARAATQSVIALLVQCPQVEHLSLNLYGSLTPDVIPVFPTLRELTDLKIANAADEAHLPLNERLVVSIAASVANVRRLSLDRIARSVIHAPELIGVCPFVPVADSDDDIPAHPLLGTELSLPSLLRLPTLKSLRIRDTHLGDANWADVPVHCALEFLDLGSCYFESQDFNRICTERIVANVGHSVGEFSLNTAITGESIHFAKPQETPLKHLRKIHLTPLFPVDNVVDTLTTLSGSPVEELSVRCYEDDVADVCAALEDFLNLRVERGDAALYQHLKEIVVDAVHDVDDDASNEARARVADALPEEQATALKRFQDFWNDIRFGRETKAASGIAGEARGSTDKCPTDAPCTYTTLES
ncbi:hypothetical protein K474DRAFT_1590296 [Panus rudis PR-1116 ss-1]|nr:hypothetical protein K474DRAFT_1590296 [Panus rudis PR-1116 ss-1]